LQDEVDYKANNKQLLANAKAALKINISLEHHHIKTYLKIITFIRKVFPFSTKYWDV